MDEKTFTEKYSHELYHYGVLGMKWGVRRNRKSASSSTPNTNIKRKRVPSEDHLQAQQLKKKKLYEMSNKELETLTRRMQLEQNYKNLNRQQISKGQKFVTDILTEVGKETAKNIVKSGVKTGMNALKKK